MIKLEIKGVRYDIDEKMRAYVDKRIGRLDKYVPRGQREGVIGTVILSEEDGRAKNRFTAEVTLQLPHDIATAKESTISLYAAIDIVEEKLKTQLLKHKSKLQNDRHARRGRRMLKGFKFRNPFGS